MVKLRCVSKDMSYKGWGLVCVFYGPTEAGTTVVKGRKKRRREEGGRMRGPQKRQENIT